MNFGRRDEEKEGGLTSGLLSHACLFVFYFIFLGFAVIAVFLPLVGLVTQPHPLTDTPGAPAGDSPVSPDLCTCFSNPVDFS